jgi:hypothetical protein
MVPSNEKDARLLEEFLADKLRMTLLLKLEFNY